MTSEEPRGGRDDDRAFDEIVEQLGLDLSFPEQEAPRHPSGADGSSAAAETDAVDELDLDDLPPDRDELFYRRVDPGPAKPWTGQRLLALAAVLGPPLLLVICTVSNYWLPRTVVLGCGLIFVAGAIWWIAQLPEHGPAHPDSPDDGAAL